MRVQCLVNSKQKLRLSHQGSGGGWDKSPGRGEGSKAKLNVKHLQSEAGYRGGCIIIGKYGHENNFKFIAFFKWT